MPRDCHMTFGRGAATREATSHAICSQRWIGWDVVRSVPLQFVVRRDGVVGVASPEHGRRKARVSPGLISMATWRHRSLCQQGEILRAHLTDGSPTNTHTWARRPVRAGSGNGRAARRASNALRVFAAPVIPNKSV